MAFWNNFPFTNFHELNLDWIIGKVKNLETGFMNVVKKVDDTLPVIKKEVDDAIQQIPTEINNVLTGWKDDGTLGTIMDTIYGGLSYLDVMKDKTIYVLGDSLSDGQAPRSWVNEFEKLLVGKNCHVINGAHSGDTMAEQYTVFDRNMTLHPENVPDILIVWCGVNDVKKQTSLTELGATMDNIRNKIQSINPNCQVYLFSTYKNYRVLPAQWIIPQTAYWRYFSQYAQQNGWTFVDMFAYAPVITPETDRMRAEFYEEQNSGYLHYTVRYRKILARFILNVLCTGMPIALGDYWERVNGSYMDGAGIFNNKAEFDPNLNGSHIRFGTRFVKIRIAGTFKPKDTSSLQYVKIGKLPDFLIPASTIYGLAYRGGGWGSTGANATFGTLVDSDGSLLVHPLAKEGTSYTSTTIYFDIYIFDLATDWQRRQTVS